MSQFIHSRVGKISKPLIAALLVFIMAVAVFYYFTSVKRIPEYNIVLITFDTTRADRIGCYGVEEVHTPNIDRLADNGTVYERCIAPTPITQPSHSTLLTGLYPFRHGIRDNSVGRLSPNVKTLAELLKDNGYATGAAVGAFVLDAKFGLDQGFDSYDDEGMLDNPQEFGFAERKAQAVTDSAIQWISKNKDSKFFFWAHYFDPHAGYAPPGIDRSALLTTLAGVKKLYELEITYTDSQMARLLNLVKTIQDETGRPTIVVVTSDHGESLQAHGEPTHGMFVYEDTVHVPLVIYDSLQKERGTRVSQPVSLADVMPTILNRVNLSAPYEIDGRILPKPGDKAVERAIYFETIMPYTNYGYSPLAGITVGKKKFIRSPKPEFYDLENDPGELNNLFNAEDQDIEEFGYSLDDLLETELNHPNISTEEIELEKYDIQKLMSLGYLASLNQQELDNEDLPDVKDKIHLHRLILRAMSLISKDKPAKCFEAVEAILQEEPDNEKAFGVIVDLARKYGAKIPADKAIGFIRRSLEKDPKAQTAIALGILYEVKKNSPAALTSFNKALELEADNLEALNNSAYYLYKLDGDLELAQQRAERTVELIDQDSQLKDSSSAGRARHTLACILIAQEKYADAVPLLQTATKLVPNYAAAYYQLGVARQELGEIPIAAKLLKHAVDLGKNTDADWLRDAKSRLSEIGQ